MKFIEEIPASEAARAQKAARLTALRKALGVACFLLAIVAILCLVGTIVTLFMAEMGSFSDDTEILLYILTGSFLGAAILAALAAVLVSRFAQNALTRELDFIERCDGENSFFVGEGTLATFANGVLRLHSQSQTNAITVPYKELRFFSVCTRHAPKERGEWSVVIEIPARYLSKNKGEKNQPPALVQTDAKERLYDCLEKEGLSLLGETPQAASEKKKFVLLKKFDLPDRKKRNRAIALLAFGAVLVLASVPVGIFLQVTAGAVLGVIGAFLFGRALYSFTRAKRMFAVYEEGVYWKELTAGESAFLKWEEIEKLETEVFNGVNVLAVRCPYGSYHFPEIEGAYEYALSVKNGRDGGE